MLWYCILEYLCCWLLHVNHRLYWYKALKAPCLVQMARNKRAFSLSFWLPASWEDVSWSHFARMRACVWDSTHRDLLNSIDLYITDNRRSLLSENWVRRSCLCALRSRSPKSSASLHAASQQQLHYQGDLGRQQCCLGRSSWPLQEAFYHAGAMEKEGPEMKIGSSMLFEVMLRSWKLELKHNLEKENNINGSALWGTKERRNRVNHSVIA